MSTFPTQPKMDYTRYRMAHICVCGCQQSELREVNCKYYYLCLGCNLPGPSADTPQKAWEDIAEVRVKFHNAATVRP